MLLGSAVGQTVTYLCATDCVLSGRSHSFVCGVVCSTNNMLQLVSIFCVLYSVVCVALSLFALRAGVRGLSFVCVCVPCVGVSVVFLYACACAACSPPTSFVSALLPFVFNT